MKVNIIQQAETRIRPFVRETPLEFSQSLSTENCRVYLKLENYQHTGSFKVRGAFNKLLKLSEEEKARGIVTASTGNHGAAVAHAMKTLRVKGIVFVPKKASATKVAAIQRLGAEIRVEGDDSVDTEYGARQFARENGMTYISPYNDLDVIAGQGTIAVELARQLETIDTIFIALGGGGLLSGIAAYLKGSKSQLRVVACSPEKSAVMIASLKAGKIVELESKPTLADGSAGGVEAGSITFEFCKQLVDETVTVSEDEIGQGIRDMVRDHHMLIEGAAGVVIAAYRRLQKQLTGNVVLVMCGANISPERLKRVL